MQMMSGPPQQDLMDSSRSNIVCGKFDSLILEALEHVEAYGEILLRGGIQRSHFRYVNHRINELGLKKTTWRDWRTSAFNDMKSPKIWYLIGLLAADGHVKTNYNGGKIPATVTLCLKDEILVSQISEFLEVKRLMNIRSASKSNKPHFALTLQSEEAVEQLKMLGFLHNKIDANFNPKIDPEFFDHFFRGFLDGDGYVSHSFGGNYRVFNASVVIPTVSQDFIQAVLQNLGALGLSPKINKSLGVGRSVELTKIGFNSHKAIIFCDWLYKRKSDSFYLDRKFQKYQDALAMYRECGFAKSHSGLSSRTDGF